MKTANELAAYCLHCPNPRCKQGCPIHNDIPEIIAKVKEGKMEEAAEILHQTNPFPEFTSVLCDCARQCQGSCVRGIKGEPVQIQLIEREAAKQPKHFKKVPENGKSVGIVGSGIASLSAAKILQEAGVHVDIYEKNDFIGGAIATGIPSYRFNKTLLAYAKRDLEAIGVRFHMGVEVGKPGHSLKELKEKHDAVLLCLGATKENMAGLSASKGYISALSLLFDYNILMQGDAYKDYKHAVVWGGGNVAMDAARTLKRILPDVKVIYRRSEKEMPANFDEIALAKEEGVEFLFLQNIVSLQKSENDELVGLKAIKMELGEPDESGRASFHEIPGSEFNLPCDLLIAALGQKVDLSPVDASLGVQEGHRTNDSKVYLAGDCFLGAKTVAACIYDGQAAAKEILEAIK